MLNYLVRYRDTVKLSMFIPPMFIYTPVLGLETLIKAKSEQAFNERFNARIGRSK